MTTERPNPKGHVFISYSSLEREQALALAGLLRRRGIGVWIDRVGIVGGTSWSAEIVEAIKGCAALLVLCSPTSMQSANVLQEIQLAWEEQRPIIPLLLQPVELPSQARYALAGRQWIEVLGHPEEDWAPRLLNALERAGIAGDRAAPGVGDAGTPSFARVAPDAYHPRPHGGGAFVAPPTGTVTFLFTDIEGSTRRWEADRDAMQAGLARHNTILRGAIERNGGYVFKTVGDGVCAAFATAPHALRAAVEGQLALAAEGWGEAVRMALHTGTADECAGDYVGPTVNRVARLEDTGHGGQILLSAVTAGLVRGSVPDGVALLDLGVYRLRDLSEPEHVHQAAIAGLRAEFPPLRVGDARHPSVPAPLTSLVGREQEIEATVGLLRSARLVTLTGSGGTGKTRVALAVAERLLPDYPDGVYFVDLSPLTGPGLVASTITLALGVREADAQPVEAALKEYLRPRHALLILDNFEHVIEAARIVRDLLAACPRLAILLTSRAVLHLPGEREYFVPPLPLPDPQRPAPPADLAESPAVALFVERARDVRPEFALTAENAPAVAEICRRLDGLPLAIELAAARVKVLAPQAMLARMGGAMQASPLQLLTGGSTALQERQQTLRNTIAWSHDLLPEAERTLFRRLAVFAGGCTLEAAEAVCEVDGDLGIDVLNGLASLVDKSLIRHEEQPDGEGRFRMLATIREFARERLADSADVATVGRSHATYFAQLMRSLNEQTSAGTLGQSAFLRTCEREVDNLRGAIQWSLTNDEPAIGLELVGASRDFWFLGGRYGEVQTWVESLLAVPASAQHPTARIAALRLVIRIAYERGDYLRHHALCEEALAMARENEDRQAIVQLLTSLANGAWAQGDFQTSRELNEQVLALAREVGDERSIAIAQGNLGEALFELGEYDGARALYRQCQQTFERLGLVWDTRIALYDQGELAQQEGDYARARAFYQESLRIAQQLDDHRGIAASFGGLARVDAALGVNERAATLLGVIDELRRNTQITLGRHQLRKLERARAAVGEALGEEAFAAAWQDGAALDLQAAIRQALKQPATA